MYAVGGCDENNFRLNSVERYNPASNTWSFTAPMTTCRSSPCVLTCRALYVIGGVSYVGMSLNTGEYLDPATNTWRAIAPMHDKRASASGAASNGKIYVIGKPVILSKGSYSWAPSVASFVLYLILIITLCPNAFFSYFCPFAVVFA